MEFRNEYISCRVDFIDNCQHIQISGIVNNRSAFKNVLLIAPNPIDKRASYSGTGLPFPCADVAFEGSENMYDIPETGAFNTTFTYPNSYYTVANKHKIVSSIFFIVEHLDGKKEFIRFQLLDQYELRTLINRETRKGPEFYSQKHDVLPVDTAEAIMREYARIKVDLRIA